MKTAVIALASLLNFSYAAKSADQPNFLFIIADDCTFRDIACYGGQAFTPNIDRLATEGMRFTRCFQAAPMCSPTRHNIYTGLYPVKSGAYPNHTFAKEGTKSVVHYLKQLNYSVALSGKTHIAPKKVFPFEYMKGGKVKNNPNMEAIDALMKKSKQNDKPFCLFACSNEPHTPWDKGDASRYKATDLKLPPYFVDTPETREAMTRYLAEITYFDSQVGDLLEMLEQNGLAENTVVMVVSEQGSAFPFGKWTCYDTGLQSACIVRWPGKVAAGVVSDAMIEYVDILPTFIDAAGGGVGADLDGESFLPVLLGNKKMHKNFVYGIMTTRGILNGSDSFGIRSIRGDRYKYIWNLTPEIEFQNISMKSPEFRSWEAKASAGDTDAADKVNRYRVRPGEELYDMTSDAYEWKNLANDPGLASVKAELRKKLEAWMKASSDKGQQTELQAFEHQVSKRGKKNDTYLFTSFRGNGEDGLHLAYSRDGLQWTAFKDDKSFLKPMIGGKLMRDPCIIQGPDGLFHMVWTTSWEDKGIGIAHSKDLINWSEQEFIPVMEHEPKARNCWAPEITWDPDEKNYVIYWATTISDQFTQTAKAADKGWNHRMYWTTTKDFRDYAKTRLFYDPGFNVIDSTIIRGHDQYVMISKDETRYPPSKNLIFATSDKVTGPWSKVSEPFSPKDLWVEGATALKVGQYWYVYFDTYMKHRYGAIRTRDFKKWEDVSDKLNVPKGMRHGTVFPVSNSILDNLLKQK